MIGMWFVAKEPQVVKGVIMVIVLKNKEGNKDKEEQWNENSPEETQWCLAGLESQSL